MKIYYVLFCNIGQYYEVLTQEEFQDFDPTVKKSYKIIKTINAPEVDEETFDVIYNKDGLYSRNIFTGEEQKIA